MKEPVARRIREIALEENRLAALYSLRILDLWRAGHDTAAIGEALSLGEAAVYRILADRRRRGELSA